MNSHSFMLAERLIPATYLQQAAAAKKSRENLIRQLIEQRKWPEEGWDDTTIELFLADLAQMDSNNFPGNCGVGEREARFACSLVAKRHYRLGHGIGRSGDLGEVQPKAAGSSLLNKLTNSLVLDVIRFMGVKTSAGCFVVPVATGMSLVLCMMTIKQERPDAKFVLWSRIDQKSSFKCIVTAGLKPIIIETAPSGDELRTDLVTMEQQMAALGAEHIACVVTTTSCFAPRASDSVDQVAVLCSRYNIPHIINNAYGLQSTRCMHLIQEAARRGRVDAFVQSTDKNFLVPVGGAIIAGFDKSFIEKISKMYPGRASSSPAMDVFITLLSLGINGYKNLISQRKEMYNYLKEELGKVASKHGEKILDTKNNPISIAMTLNSLAGTDTKTITMLGSMLFLRSVSGTRVITGNDIKDVAGCKFEGWGAHNSNYPTPYLTAAAALGIRKSDVDLFVHRLDKVLSKLKGRSAPPTPTSVRRVMRSSGGGGGGSSTLNGDGGSNSGSGGEQQSQSSAKSSAKSSASTSLASSKDSLRK
ncbi:UGA suppressor tRNA-associated protein, putative [Pediculus humanus corporis]|uniref:O-phosphoseryl-tRNA(Sec) selenium transferase n=1 Tax=Pediculus humanus subsp. corporis TaxID=121224 RepID=E0VIG8_PEDHC|nr:UGA suppressor tRNA-associated protein, putative [Pediculus humanus corporis]EEB13174.1 UGA suppressor tRNA-associated protein, putative [Pediculus humanus corporis]